MKGVVVGTFRCGYGVLLAHTFRARGGEEMKLTQVDRTSATVLIYKNG